MNVLLWGGGCAFHPARAGGFGRMWPADRNANFVFAFLHLYVYPRKQTSLISKGVSQSTEATGERRGGKSSVSPR